MHTFGSHTHTHTRTRTKRSKDVASFPVTVKIKVISFAFVAHFVSKFTFFLSFLSSDKGVVVCVSYVGMENCGIVLRIG